MRLFLSLHPSSSLPHSSIVGSHSTPTVSTHPSTVHIWIPTVTTPIPIHPLPNNSTTLLPTTSSSTPNAAADHSYGATYPSGSNPANKQGSIRFGALAAAVIVVFLAVLSMAHGHGTPFCIQHKTDQQDTCAERAGQGH
ncbi:hypothetical protein B0H14DRAFT_3129295 [Mycena olivaceomarginata]|nr:hypothetical protein B0H14DRAFT_3129295 [Mycena olivaceomarginata]